jgi:hypothetical protein
VRDASLNARNPFTPTKGAERSQSYEGNVGGTLVKNKSSFSLSVERRNAFDTPIINFALPTGHRSEVLNIHRPNDNWSFYGLVDYALTRDQTLRVSYDQSNTTRKNLGLGGFDYLPERAYETASQDHEFRAQVVGPFGRRTFANTRLQITSVNTVSHSAVELPTVRVVDSATSGGAQVVGGRHPKDLEVASDVDHVRGMNTVRAGFLVNGGQYRSDDATNYLGTYTFTSLDAFNAGRRSRPIPARHTRSRPASTTTAIRSSTIGPPGLGATACARPASPRCRRICRIQLGSDSRASRRHSRKEAASARRRQPAGTGWH